MKFKEVSSYWLFDEVKSGKRVYALDRKLRKISVVNDLSVDLLVAVMNSAHEEHSRYEFWYEEAEETDVTEEPKTTKVLEEDEDG